MQSKSDFLLLIGRIALSTIFLMSGLQKISNYGGTVEQISSQGIPLATLAAGIAIFLEIVGGLSVLTGYKTRFGAWLLVLFLIPATFFFHDFWDFPQQEMQGQMIHFMKNLSILGGLLMMTVYDPGDISVGGEND